MKSRTRSVRMGSSFPSRVSRRFCCWFNVRWFMIWRRSCRSAEHPIKMCSTDSRISHAWQIGGWDLSRRWPWVRRVWPHLSRARITSRFLFCWLHVLHAWSLGLILYMWPAWVSFHLRCKYSLNLTLVKWTTSPGASGSRTALGSCAPSLAKISARSFPATPQCPGIHRNVTCWYS